MTISIHHKLKPFSHIKGQAVLIPGFSTLFRSYPCRLEGYNLFHLKPLFSLDLKIADYYLDFTTEVDYEKKVLRIFGRPEAGFIELKIFKKDHDLMLKLERCFQDRLEVLLDGKALTLTVKEVVKIAEENFSIFDTCERIDFGVSKKQDMLSIEEKKCLKQYLPYIFSLGTKLKIGEPLNSAYPLSFIKTWHSLNQNELKKALDKILHGFFSLGFIPSFDDGLHQGLGCEDSAKLSPLYLLSQVAFWFKDALVKQTGSTLEFFSQLPKELVAGKACDLCFDFGRVHIEWTKGFLRQVVIVVEKDVGLDLVFPKNVKSFRMKKNKKLHPQTHIFTQGVYHIDRFQA
jgi:hypothetical protein